jgi:hypothetical protein
MLVDRMDNATSFGASLSCQSLITLARPSRLCSVARSAPLVTRPRPAPGTSSVVVRFLFWVEEIGSSNLPRGHGKCGSIHTGSIVNVCVILDGGGTPSPTAPAVPATSPRTRRHIGVYCGPVLLICRRTGHGLPHPHTRPGTRRCPAVRSSAGRLLRWPGTGLNLCIQPPWAQAHRQRDSRQACAWQATPSLLCCT